LSQHQASGQHQNTRDDNVSMCLGHMLFRYSN
jgi:hypothetical protein